MSSLSKVKNFSNTSGVSKKGNYKFASSTFYFLNSSKIKTTISFLDYWSLKNNTKVNIIYNIFDMNGRLLETDNVNFKRGNVKNIRPLNHKIGEGAIEIKISSDSNLRIPYAAIVGVYKTKFGISAVHSYSRYYYQKDDVLSNGNEGSWTIRDSKEVCSFCIYHNGPKEQGYQVSKIEIINKKGEKLGVKIKIPAIPPNGTIKIRLRDYVKNLIEFLDGDIGIASSEHKVQKSFSRMLIGNESIIHGEDMQVTHSNFNYKIHGSDLLNDKQKSLKPYPGKVNKYSEFIIYPHLVSGFYKAKLGKKIVDVNNNKEIIRIPVDKKFREVNILPAKSKVPSRFQLGIVSRLNSKRIPNEVAFSAITSIEPLKRFHWCICALGKKINTKIIILDLKNLDPKKNVKKELTISLYRSTSKKIRYIKFPYREAFKEGISIYRIFKELNKPVKNEYAYFSVFSEYGRFLCYCEIVNQYNSILKEHSF